MKKKWSIIVGGIILVLFGCQSDEYHYLKFPDCQCSNPSTGWLPTGSIELPNNMEELIVNDSVYVHSYCIIEDTFCIRRIDLK
jgi:hypothetical protein